MQHSFRFIDLFAGLGGFHVALQQLGGECVFASELKPTLRETYELNFGIKPEGDITNIDPSTIPDHDILTAGFPCQPFSKAGEQLGFDCTKQGNLFFYVANILKEKKPTYFILENVPNLLKHNNGATWKQIQDILGPQGLGYNLKAQQLSPHFFGIPQIRDRVYIVGSLNSLAAFNWPVSSHDVASIESVLDKSPPEAKTLSPQVIKCLNVWDNFLQICPKTTELPSFPLWSMEWGATYPYEETTPYALVNSQNNDLKNARGAHGKVLRNMSTEELWASLPSYARTAQESFPAWKVQFIRQNRTFYAENKTWIDNWLPNILEFPSSLQKLEWNIKGGVRDIWSYVLQFRASGVRVKRRTTAPSLIAMTSTQVPIIGWEKRYMTVKECARLQSLESLIHLPATSNASFRALGNAVNSQVVERVAKSLLLSSEMFLINEHIENERALVACIG